MVFNFRQPATIQAALRQAELFLEAAGVADARPALEWLFSRAIGCARLELHLKRGERLPPQTCRRLEAQIERLAVHEPLQYVQGEAEFMGHLFAADRRALIPRPETEQLTEAVLACEPLWKRASPALVDVGTGSGCIIISLALARPEAQYHAIDNDPAALELARSNARRHRVLRRIRFRAGDLLEMFAPASLDAVVSNPPYVRTGDWEQLPAQIRDYEPRAALDGGADGLAVIRPLISQAGRVLKPGGRLFLEIGAEQAKSVRSLLAANNFTDCAIRADLAGKHRIASARRPDGP